MRHRVLFVCLGNICRSPMVEAVFAQRVRDLGLAERFTIDSCGTANYHVGEGPDPRTIATCKRHGVPIDHSLSKGDFDAFDFVFAMDESNLENILRRKPAGSAAVVQLFGEHDPERQRIIEDPYYGGIEGFEQVYAQARRCSDGFLRSLGLLPLAP